MAVRSFKVAVQVPRDQSPQSVEARKALWNAHAFTNGAVGFYEDLLLELRQGDVCVGRTDDDVDQMLPAEEMATRLRTRFVARGAPVAALEAALPLLRSLYEEVVPSATNPNGGSTQQARGWHSPMVDPGSKGNATHPIALGLRERGLLPVAAPYSVGRIEPKARGLLNDFERSAFQMAVEHVAGWETKSHAARATVEKRRDERYRLFGLILESAPDAYLAIQSWEEQRRQTFKRLHQRAEYTIGLREIKGWPEIRTRLKALNSDDPSDRAGVVKDYQRRTPKRFGGATLLDWLAAPEQRWLAEHPAGDVVTVIANLNEAEKALGKAHAHPVFTRADSRRHPRFMKLAKVTDNNSPKYKLVRDDQGLKVSLCLLSPGETGLLTPTWVDFRLADHGQLRDLQIDPTNNLSVSWEEQDGSGRASGELMGATVLFDRRHLEITDPAALRQGCLGHSRVWLKLAIDVKPYNEAELDRRKKIRNHLSRAIQNRKPGDMTDQPFRVLSVDLGLRAAATATVFTVNPPDQSKTWPLSDRCGLTMAREGSYSLYLDGDQPDEDTLSRRWEAMSGLRALRRRLRPLRSLAQVWGLSDSKDRLGVLGELSEAEDPESPIGRLLSMADAPDPDWRAAVVEVYRILERPLGQDIKAHKRKWARSSKSLGQLSIWAVQYKEEILRLKKSWTHRARPGSETDRSKKRQHWAFREHINNLREDRSKKTADLIVQAARGYVREGGKWVQRHAPVDLILLEKLDEYRPSKGKAPSDNEKLRQWSHRAVSKRVVEQAEAEGIPVADVDPKFSSRFDALTRAPGLRCRALTTADIRALQNPTGWLRKSLMTDYAHLRMDPDSLRVGDLVPDRGGRLLVSLSDRNPTGLRQIDADVNASRGLCARYVEGYATPVYVNGSLMKTSVGPRVILNFGDNNKRLVGAFGGPVVSMVGEEQDGVMTWTPTVYQTKHAAAKALGLAMSAVEVSNDDVEQDVQLNVSGAKITLQRDPSGQVYGGRWVEAKDFWTYVSREVGRRLKARNGTPTPTDRSPRKSSPKRNDCHLIPPDFEPVPMKWVAFSDGTSLVTDPATIARVVVSKNLSCASPEVATPSVAPSMVRPNDGESPGSDNLRHQPVEQIFLFPSSK